MRILIGHNRYQWAGGEDAVVETESRLLREAGHEVLLFTADNDRQDLSQVGRVADLFWSRPSYERLTRALLSFKPDVAHFHNIYFALTPSVYDACHARGVAVVQSLHNFRMLCANGLFFRDGKVCEDCVQKSPWEGIKHRCYKDSYLASGAVTAVIAFHRWRKTWGTRVDRYITATEFTRGKYIQAGLPPEKITVKANVFAPSDKWVEPRGEYALYVGRLSREKGVDLLLKAWERLRHIPLKLMGDGPLASELRAWVKGKNLDHIEFLGAVDKAHYAAVMQAAKFLVIPSQCYENFPRIAVEAFAFGLPVLASSLGSLREIIIEGENGFCFDPLDGDELARRAQEIWRMDTRAMARRVRSIFETRYDPARNIQQLLAVYAQAKEEIRCLK